jgi:hypothetical protein
MLAILKCHHSSARDSERSESKPDRIERLVNGGKGEG